MSQLSQNELSTEELKKRLFWASRKMELWLLLPLILPQLYYAVFVPALAIPEGLMGWLADMFSVFGKFGEQFDPAEAERYGNAYAIALMAGIICLPIGVWKYYQFSYLDFVYSEKVGGERLARRKKHIRLSSKPLAFLFKLFLILVFPAFSFWLAFYNQIVPILWASASAPVSFVCLSMFIDQYVKRSWCSG